MKCPVCNVWTSVKRTEVKGDSVQRQRVCANMHSFTTEERVVPSKQHGGSNKNRALKGEGK